MTSNSESHARSCSWSPARVQMQTAAAAKSGQLPIRHQQQHASVESPPPPTLNSRYSSPALQSPRPVQLAQARSMANIVLRDADASPVPKLPRKSRSRQQLASRNGRQNDSCFTDAQMQVQMQLQHQQQMQSHRRWGAMGGSDRRHPALQQERSIHNDEPLAIPDVADERQAQAQTQTQTQTPSHPQTATKTDMMDEVARLEKETDRILAEQKRLDLERLQTILSTPTSNNTSSTPSSKSKRSLLGISFSPCLSWRKRSAPASPSMSPYTVHSEPGTSAKPQHWDIPNASAHHQASLCSSPASKSPVTPRKHLRFALNPPKASVDADAVGWKAKEAKTVAVVPCAAGQTFRVIRAEGCLVIECYYE